MLRGPFGYRGQMDEVMPLWRENAEYLLARVGRSERTISVDGAQVEEDTGAEPKVAPVDAVDEAVPAPEGTTEAGVEPAAQEAPPADAEAAETEKAQTVTTDAPAGEGPED